MTQPLPIIPENYRTGFVRQPTARIVPLGDSPVDMQEKLAPTLPDWTCGTCGHLNGGHDNACGQCRAHLPTIALFTVQYYYSPGRRLIRIKWEVYEADEIWLQPGLTALPARGYADLDPEYETSDVYTLVAANATGRRSIQATPVEQAPRIRYFRAAPPQVQIGVPVILHWEVENAERVIIEPVGEVSDQSFVEAFFTEPRICILRASNPNGEVQSAITLRMSPPEIRSFHANTLTISHEEVVEFFWETTNAETLRLVDEWGNSTELEGISQIEVHPDRSTTYRLEAGNAAGDVHKTLRVVLPPPRILTFGSETHLSTEDRGAELVWDVAFAHTVTIEPLVGRVPARGSVKVRPRQAITTFTLRAEGYEGKTEAQFEVIRFPLPLDAFDFSINQLNQLIPMEAPGNKHATVNDLDQLEQELRNFTRDQLRAKRLKAAAERQLTEDLLNLEKAHVRHELRHLFRRIKSAFRSKNNL